MLGSTRGGAAGLAGERAVFAQGVATGVIGSRCARRREVGCTYVEECGCIGPAAGGGVVGSTRRSKLKSSRCADRAGDGGGGGLLELPGRWEILLDS